MFLSIAFLSLLVERATGYPDRLFTAIGHPVTWIGALIERLDRRWNRKTDSTARRRQAGLAALVTIAALAGGAGLGLQALLMTLPASIALALAACLAATLIAQKSLDDHVAIVASALESSGLDAGRAAVSQIVGRDPDTLDRAGVSRAAIESLAENFSDGVTAPVFWLALAGLPGIAIYKAVNTADSMIGHRTPRHEAFGRAAARFDDLINLPASRLTALALVAAAAILPNMSGRDAWRAVRRDAKNHRSPNAGWPEAAMAGALGLALAGPRTYDGVVVDDAVMGQGGRRSADASDIRRALTLYRWADGLLIVSTGALAVLVSGHW
ncbi:cobalamin biosynthesis protein CobD [Nitratireductor sp. CAU 1489]|uniref:Cobalamin biosynthesis protein CobD n=1 Tax=Nitratireductor arenosus TaxID=2682096 RepID=A0A844QK65_9HYPH|nr:adenosylcobinamide-phosphate synthase CbiB [Nitratireductor arenosus]MVA99695.1 cobalamin biosynthesis protein CobD [Nitratireductor arenosus]